jgi:superfamily II DNA or RNA helicase
VELIIAASSWKDFEQSVETLGNTEKGRAFEELTRLHLLTDPTFSIKIEELWHHSDVPQKVVDELGLQRPEIGVDLVARVTDGSYWAIQCKFHQDRTKNVTYEELSTFFSITERDKTYPKLSHRLVCTSANGISLRVDKAHPEKLGYLTSLEFSKLGKEQFDAFRALLGGGHPAPEPFEPRDHQKDALEKVDEFFNGSANTRGKIIHPCGSGKSLTGYWISQALKSKRVIIAVPSLALVRQTLGSWTREAVANNVDMDWIAVCSDDDVKNSDDPSMHKVDLGIEVDTDPDVVAAFLSKRTKGTKVLITTYQSGQAVSEGVKKAGIVFDLGVYDEAHKTVGQKDKAFAHLLYDENVKVRKRVFMTATERQFKGNSDEYLSMDDEDVYGTIIDELSFKAALEQDPPILSDYKIVSTIVTKSEIDQLINKNKFVKSDGKDWSAEGDASTFASLIALRKLVKERDIKHVVSFHSSIKRSKDFMALNAEISKADNSFGELSSFHVSGKDSTGVRAAVLDRFVDAEPSLITNARCLTEGVDVPAIDAVLFADPKQSKIDIVQAAGRALRKFEGKDFGYIIVPVVLDDEAEDPSDDAFKQIITVISALGMHDERIIEEFKEIAKGNSEGRRIVEVDMPEIVRVKFEDFIANVEIQIWDRLSFGWAKGFEQLKKYVEQHSNARVSSRYIDGEGFSLGTWVNNRRMNYKSNQLKSDSIKQLEALEGWEWDPFEASFQYGLGQLEKYVVGGHSARVHANFVDSDEFNLGRWVAGCRVAYNKKKMGLERVQQLEAFEGWIWNTLEADFQYGLGQLKKHVKHEGSAMFSMSYIDDDGFALGTWVANLRRAKKNNKLDSYPIQQLEAINGWLWSIRDMGFPNGLRQLEKYVAQNSNARVPNTYMDEDEFNLGRWVSRQRQRYINGTLEADRSKILEAVDGWIWDPMEADFQYGLGQLKKYVKREGSARIPALYIDDDKFALGGWVQNQRRAMKNNKLGSGRIQQFVSIRGWEWDLKEADFQYGLMQLKKYAKQNSNARVPVRCKIEGFSLGTWVNNRRSEYQKNQLKSDRIQQLETIEGWIWDPMEADFQYGLGQLKKYVKREGSARVPARTIEDGFALGGWVAHRRTDYKHGKLSPERIKDLELNKGWVW